MKKSTSGSHREGVVDWRAVETIGVDLGDRFSHFACLDRNGKQIGEGRVQTTAAGFEKLFGAMGSKLIAIETGTHSPWVSRLLKGLGHRVIVANSRKLRLIYENRSKSDKVDAEYLARLARVDPKLLSPVEHRSQTAQQDTALLRARDTLVRTRSRLISHVRGAVKSMGMRVPACSAEAFEKRAAAMLPESLRATLELLLTVVRQVNEQIRAFDRKIEGLLEQEYRHAKVLTQIGGVGALTAVAFAATVGDRERFPRSRTVGAWVGLTPARHSSGEQDPQLRISKEGDEYLRRLLVGSAQYILGPFGPDCDLRRHGLKIAQRGGKNAKKRAVVAVARKLAVLMHRLWCTQAVYEPLRNNKTTAVAA